MDKESKDFKKEDSHEEDIEKPSYTYWKRESDKPFSNEFKPVKSETVASNNTNTNYGSAWNTAGTWEEKHLNKNQFEDFFNKSLKTIQVNFKDTFTIENINSYTGDTYYVFIRGKIKFVYDCEFSLSVKGLNEFEEVSGEVKVKEINNHDLDDDFEYDYSGKFNGDPDKAKVIINIARKEQSQIQKFIRLLFDDLKEACLKKGSNQTTEQNNNNNLI